MDHDKVKREQADEMLHTSDENAMRSGHEDKDSPGVRKQPRTAGMYTGPVTVQGTEVEAYLEREWKP